MDSMQLGNEYNKKCRVLLIRSLKSMKEGHQEFDGVASMDDWSDNQEDLIKEIESFLEGK